LDTYFENFEVLKWKRPNLTVGLRIGLTRFVSLKTFESYVKHIEAQNRQA